MLLLRMKLSQPELRNVWPGTPSLTKPESEVRLLYDEVLPFDDVRAAVDEESTNPDSKFAAADIRLLKDALATLKPVSSQHLTMPVP